MKTLVSTRRFTLLLGSLMLFLCSPVPAADNKPKSEPIYTIVVEGGAATKVPPWKRLQAFHVRLRELLGVAEGADLQTVDIGCYECAALENREGPKGEPKNPPAKLTYLFYGEDRATVSQTFMDAVDAVRKDKMLWDDSFVVSVNGKPVAASACTDYPPPCYNRPVCTLYSGCSKSQYSCTKCTGM